MKKEFFMRRLIALLTAGFLMITLAGCQKKEAAAQIFAMDTVMNMAAYGGSAEKALAETEAEILRLEQLLSRTDADSEVSRLNTAGGAPVDIHADVETLIRSAGAFSAATDGAFDITIAPVVSAWGFTEDAYRVPEQAELEALLETVGMEHVTLADGQAALEGGTRIDLGGIAKGYASDRAAEIFDAHKVEHGQAALGGNILLVGPKPDGTAWRVGVQDPARPNEDAYAAIVALEDAFAVTSGSYQRYFEQDGAIYHHIIDPANGYPADSGLTSVTVVTDRRSGSGTMCDALSTALFVMGEERALEFWRSGVYDFELILVTEDGRVVVTAGLETALTEIEESGYTYEIVS